jgi:threonine dehydrogenase-like Zn-dependent dehydrogenase
MRALVASRADGLRLREVAAPDEDSFCRIRVSMAGICGTDLQILEGYAGFDGIPGHEFVGVVDRAPAEHQRWIGKRVVGEINIACGQCGWCRQGVKEHCENRSVLGIRQHGGAFAEYTSLPAVNLHEVPDSIDDETAVFVEPTAAACRILEQMAVAAGARVAVVGDGRMGLLTAQVLRTATPDVTVFGRHASKLAIARALRLETAQSDSALSPSSRFDVVVDVTGRPEGMTRAIEIVRPRGTVVMKSTFHGVAPIESWPIVVDEIVLLGSRCGPFRPAIDLLGSGAVQVKPLISRIAPLAEFESAFAEAGRGLKILFDLNR